MNEHQIKMNVEAREIAEAALSLALDEWQSKYFDNYDQMFWKRVKAVVESKLPKAELPPQPGGMSSDEARLFGQRMTMPAGKYAGQPVDKVPIDYLLWWAFEPSDFTKQLRRYLRSERIQREIEQSDNTLA